MIEIPNVAIFLDRNTIEFQRTLDADIERVWRAITTEEELGQWFMPTEIDLRVGGRFSFKGGWEGTVGELNPMESIQFNNADGGITRFEVAAKEEGSSFSIIDRLPPDFVSPFQDTNKEEENYSAYGAQIGGPGTHWVGVVAGWHGFADGLEGYVDSKEGQISMEAYNRLCRLYHEYLREYYTNMATEHDASHPSDVDPRRFDRLLDSRLLNS